MKIKEVKIRNFKRFTDLTIENIPETVKLIILVGPNGSGKTSLFEAFNHWVKVKAFYNHGDKLFVNKMGEDIIEARQQVDVKFFNYELKNNEDAKGKFYFRSAYRNEPDFTVNTIQQQTVPTEKLKLETLMHNDLTVSENYQRLISQTVAGVFDTDNSTKTVEELREELIGKIRKSLSNIFDDLNLSSIGHPLSNGSFYFEKGISKDFHYKNLSAGEKSVFDLVLDLIIKSSFYKDAVYFIDEPEAHMHTRLQAKLLKELYSLTPNESQLWISTHSIGMLKEAEEIENENPGTVVFLDFDNRNFDTTETINPAKIDKAIWDKFFDLTFADFAKLISPKKIVFCEGNSAGRQYKDFDAQIYSIIFGNSYHDTKFISLGSCSEIENIENNSVRVVSNILKASEIIKIVDRDDKSDEEVVENLEKGIKTLDKRHIESYILDDEIITKLCKTEGREDLISICLEAKMKAIEESISRGNPSDDIKSASGKIFTELKRILGINRSGNNKCAFFRDKMAKLITEETNIYKNLEREIFA
ncbi:AAA family ATPase [Elizabethkingia anophelis]|uniref:AAA family ATPase n=1 Tax=Elizabethkingia anophelis TaxID=1117645 RepID=UPI0024E1AC74|nr:ATP-binding protein [Elizabethkingia anophelis]CAH1136626.1 DNA replication and repair protein RecF [Elizabethkingia anophelis]CAH1147795.1 DNA replication and repair protein RecF [Elizabethkingia anophelis]CAI9670125.1 DNA replication and repair protein RecF [Elizabethkingia anophelis]CAI9674270.1 DNA replication and repair protein RecF [Elizabethkingia anophelis]CAI9681144.1 DNA replication and repair protein RecF [Elizabethkingia anophelis]